MTSGPRFACIPIRLQSKLFFLCPAVSSILLSFIAFTWNPVFDYTVGGQKYAIGTMGYETQGKTQKLGLSYTPPPSWPPIVHSVPMLLLFHFIGNIPLLCLVLLLVFHSIRVRKSSSRSWIDTWGKEIRGLGPWIRLLSAVSCALVGALILADAVIWVEAVLEGYDFHADVLGYFFILVCGSAVVLWVPVQVAAWSQYRYDCSSRSTSSSREQSSSSAKSSSRSRITSSRSGSGR